MRAIDVLFTKIDELNSNIKLESEIHNKIMLALQIKKIVEIITHIEELKVQCGDGEYV